VDDYTAVVERVRAQRLAILSTMPCSTCDIESDVAQSCKFFDQTGCKHVEALIERRRVEERVQSRRANLLRAGFDSSLIDADDKMQLILRDTLEPWKAVHAVRRALTSKSLRFLVLGGDHRTGKTFALIYACAVRSKAVYIRAQQLSKLNQDTQRWIDAEVLCVNELGREHLGNGFTASNLDELMAEREYGKKLTVFATNLPLRKRNANDPAELPALADRYGDLFASRIGHGIGAYVVCAQGAAIDTGPVQNNPTAFNERGEK
jgi:hypothetical protein